jgi:hypothetical protein
MASTRQSNTNTPVVCLATYYVLGQRRIEVGYRCDRSIG